MHGVAFGGKVGDAAKVWKLKMRVYADDKAIISPSMAAAQSDIDAFASACTVAGLVISVKKTEFMCMEDKRAPKRKKEMEVDQRRPPWMGVTSDGMRTYAAPAHEWVTKRFTCPFLGCVKQTVTSCPGMALASLRKHFQDVHGVAILVGREFRNQAGPEYIHVPANEVKRRWRCGTCAAKAQPLLRDFSGKSGVRGHWKTDHEPLGEGRILTYVRFAGGDWKSVLPPTEGFAVNKHRNYHKWVSSIAMNVDDVQPAGLTVDGKALAEVRNFKYLGRMVSSNNRDELAVQARISIAETTGRSLTQTVFKRGSIHTKAKVFNTIIRAQVAYGLETAVFSDKSKRKLTSFQMRWARRITNLPPKFNQQLNHVVYPESRSVLASANMVPIVDYINYHRLKLVGHILRRGAGDPVRQSFLDEFPLAGRPSIDGKRSSLRQLCNGLMVEAGLKVEDASSRVKWRTLADRWIGQRKQKALEGAAAAAPGDTQARRLELVDPGPLLG